MNGYFGEDCLVDNSGNHKLIGRIGNDHLIGRSYAVDTLVCGLGCDALIGFCSFESEIKTFDREVVKEGKNYQDVLDFTFYS